MKTGIHPANNKVKVTCTCGAKHDLVMTLNSLKVEICSACHSFYTGKEKSTANASRVARFRARQEATAS